jgi:hypothetical protein
MRGYRVGRRGVVTVAVVLVLAALGPARSAHAASTATKCRAAILKEGAKLLAGRAKTLLKCWDAVAAGKGAGPCPDAKAAERIATIDLKLASGIAKACGGKDKVCGPGGEPDVNLAAIGWNIVSCANVGDGTCTNAIADCRDVATCVACVADKAVDQTFDLYYDLPAIQAAGADVRLRTCLRAIGKAGANAIAKTSNQLFSCWLDVSKADTGGSFSCPSAKTAAGIARSGIKTTRFVCQQCGGANGCGEGGDIPIASTGFPAQCPAIGACGGAVQTIRDLIGCANCVTGAVADRAARSAIPAFSSTSPPQCPMPTATPP